MRGMFARHLAMRAGMPSTISCSATLMICDLYSFSRVDGGRGTQPISRKHSGDLDRPLFADSEVSHELLERMPHARSATKGNGVRERKNAQSSIGRRRFSRET